MTEALLTPLPVLKIGRKHTLHLARVLIEDGRVVVRTRCGIPRDDEFTHTFGIPTCDSCNADHEGVAS